MIEDTKMERALGFLVSSAEQSAINHTERGNFLVVDIENQVAAYVVINADAQNADEQWEMLKLFSKKLAQMIKKQERPAYSVR